MILARLAQEAMGSSELEGPKNHLKYFPVPVTTQF